jgi:hypothetical protein
MSAIESEARAAAGARHVAGLRAVARALTDPERMLGGDI